MSKQTPSGNTKPRQFRLGDDTIATIDALKVRLGLPSRADVLRFAVARLAGAELAPKKNSRKSGQ